MTTGKRCPGCGASLDGAPGHCASCGASAVGELAIPSDTGGYSTRISSGLENAARIAGGGGATTLFQPRLLTDRPGEDDASGAVAAPGLGTGESATRVSTFSASASPALQLDVEPFLLLLGAPPGEERIALRGARTTFGRGRADVDLADAEVSALHFQIDVMGREFFVRDLGSRNGTWLNGHPVRYSEILPGDELRAGQAVLVFRTSGDGVSAPRRGRQ